MGFLSGKRILVTGVASKLSIAYGIAQAMHREGAELAFTYQNDKLKGRVEEFAAQLDSSIILECDVAQDESIDGMFAELAKTWPKFDGFVHSIGFAPGDQLDGDYVNAVTREGFKIAHDISSYSFVAMAKACRSMLNPGSALLTLSYLGAERAIPNYNVMGLAKASLEANVRYMANAMGPEGVRVNGISAGPIRTLAASGIKDFRKMLAHCEAVTPIRRTVTIEDVGNSAAFLCSDLSAGISGEVVHVDGGFNIAAMNELEIKYVRALPAPAGRCARQHLSVGFLPLFFPSLFRSAICYHLTIFFRLSALRQDIDRYVEIKECTWNNAVFLAKATGITRPSPVAARRKSCLWFPKPHRWRIVFC
jgi:enoyl-[acyl-carrier protein] reductase I